MPAAGCAVWSACTSSAARLAARSEQLLQCQFADNQGKVLTDSIALYADWTFDLTSSSSSMSAPATPTRTSARSCSTASTPTGLSRPVAVTADFDKKTNFKNVSPKVSLDYQITPDIMVYGLATRGFKSGGYNIRANAVAVPRSAEPFDDETVDSHEVGSKMAFLDQRLFLNLSAFYNKYKDIQLSVFTGLDTNGDGIDDSFFGDFTNAGAGTVNGLEVEYQYLPSQHWLISGNLAWLDTSTTSTWTVASTWPGR
jgi:iron complex outermembrane receptor protein